MMTLFLGIMPVFVAIVCLVFRRGPVVAAGGGLVAAALITVAGPFTLEAEDFAKALPYAGLTFEVLTILLFGMILARLLQYTGAMKQIADFIEQSAPSRMAGTALVVFGVVPFAESVTGFGIGITVGVPILLSLGHPAPRATLLGLLGMIAVPWGAMGPGTAVAASLAGLDLDALGVATGTVNIVPTLISAGTVLWICRKDCNFSNSFRLFGTAVALWASILAANKLIGTPPAGVFGSLIVIFGLLFIFRGRGKQIGFDSELFRSLAPYTVLTVGILTTRLLLRGNDHLLAQIAVSPSTWLAIACLVVPLVLPASNFGKQLPDAMRAWIPVGFSTAGFMLMGWLMSVNGMSETIGSAVSFAGTAPGPFLTSAGSILTGSNTGANAMFMSTVLALAESSGSEILGMVAIANASGSFAAMANPPRVAMAVALAFAGKSADPERSHNPDLLKITSRTLVVTIVISGIATTLLAVAGAAGLPHR
ncbi:MAG TPA: hypothetical protein VK041_06605 [Opitutales bacterium]|nr:hypothetical protein [Opitutales bacterium]